MYVFRKGKQGELELTVLINWDVVEVFSAKVHKPRVSVEPSVVAVMKPLSSICILCLVSFGRCYKVIQSFS